METAAGRTAHSVRVALGGVILGGALCALAAFFSASSATADDGGGSDSGLLGVVGTTVSQVSDTAADVTGVVGEVVSQTVEQVAPVTAPVVAPLPEPVVAPVATTVESVAQGADDAVQAVDAVVTGSVDAAVDGVSDVAAGGPVGGAVDPVTDAVSGLPVVGDVVDALGVDDALDTVVGDVDHSVGVVVGATQTVGGSDGGVLPHLPVGRNEVGGVLDPPFSPLPGGSLLPVLVLPPSVSGPSDPSSGPLGAGSEGRTPRSAAQDVPAPAGSPLSSSFFLLPPETGRSVAPGAPALPIPAPDPAPLSPTSGASNSSAGVSGALLPARLSATAAFGAGAVTLASDEDPVPSPTYDTDVSPD